MRTHEKLEVWKKSVEFVVATYKATENFPKEERFGLTSQIRRARQFQFRQILRREPIEHPNKEFLPKAQQVNYRPSR
jgi:hypothetical protein